MDAVLSHCLQPGSARDLLRLAPIITATDQHRDGYFTISSLISAMYRADGAACVPYVPQALEETDSDRVHLRPARILLREDHPAAWSFAVTALEKGPRSNWQLFETIGELYPELKADQHAMLELAKRRANR